MKYVYDFFQLMQERNVVFVYQGEFTHRITGSILEMAERNLRLLEEEEATKRKLFTILVECLQNISFHHTKDKKQETDKAIFIIAREEKKYVIMSGNFIHADKIAELKMQLDEINQLDKDGLRELYKHTLQHGEISKKGGAGLGFIDMARKSGSKLEYDFHLVSDEIAFFSLRMSVATAFMH